MCSISLSQWWSVASSGEFSLCVYVRRRRGGRAAGRKRGSSRRTHTTHMLPKPFTQSPPTAGNPTLYDALMEMSFLLWVHTHTILHTYLLALTYSHIFQSRVEINGKVTKTLSKLNMWLQCPCNEFLDLFVFVTFFFISLIAFLIIWMENWFNPLMHKITP